MSYEQGDTITFDVEPFEDEQFTVTDVDEQDIGLTTVTVVGLELDGEAYALKTASHSDTAELSKIGESGEWEVRV